MVIIKWNTEVIVLIFEKELLSFNLLEVLSLKQRNVNMSNNGRNFSALSFRIHSDTVLLTDSDEYHLTDNCVSFVPSRFDYRRISKTDELIVIHFEITNYRAECIEFFLSQNPERLEGLFREILSVWNKREAGYKHQASAILYEIFAECYRQNFHHKNELSKIHRSVEYINKHYTDPNLSVFKIAQQSYMSEVYFRRLFNLEFGTSPQKYIVHLRILHAKGLISTGYHTLKEVAYLSGYTDYKYFSVEFKKKVGVSPSEYVYNYKE